jgi:cystathionine beta-lyase/cystathionine gamma-synthase
MTDVFSAETRLIHAGTERVPGQPATPPLAPASIYVSHGTPGRGRIVLPEDGYYGGRVLADRLRPHSTRPVRVDLRNLAAVERELTAAPSVQWAETPIRLSVGVEPAADLITDIDHALEVL